MCIKCGKLCGLSVDSECGKVDCFLLEERGVACSDCDYAHGQQLSTGYPQTNPPFRGDISTQTKTKTCPRERARFPVIHAATITTAYIFIC